MGLMSVFLIGLAGKETMFIKFSCSQTFSRYSQKHSGFICVYFFLFGQLFFFFHLFVFSSLFSNPPQTLPPNKSS